MFKICKKTFTERRAIVNNIPHGEYCYSKENCPYWKYLSSNKEGYVEKAKCRLYNIKDDYPQDLKLLWDQVKVCGINMDR